MKKLESTKNIHKASLLRVYKKGFGYDRLTVLDNTEWYMAVKSGPDFYNAAKEGDEIQVYLWVEDVASYEFSQKIIGRISTDSILFLDHTEKIDRSSERKCLTATVDIPFKFFVFNPADIHKAVSSEKVVFNQGRVVLLEDRVLTVKCGEPLSEHAFLKGHLPLPGGEIEIVGKIQLINEKKFIYLVELTGMTDKDRNTLLDYIFSIYRE